MNVGGSTALWGDREQPLRSTSVALPEAPAARAPGPAWVGGTNQQLGDLAWKGAPRAGGQSPGSGAPPGHPPPSDSPWATPRIFAAQALGDTGLRSLRWLLEGPEELSAGFRRALTSLCMIMDRAFLA